MINKAMSLYLDTSVIGGYFDKEFERDTRLLFQKIKEGEYIVFISDLVEDELENAPERVKKILDELDYKLIEITPECRTLAGEYIKEKVVGEASSDDCTHIATATINGIDFLVSWNFKHIVNVKRIKNYNSVNIKNGYRSLEIRSPKDMGVL
ncbi:MAG: type II toxin-antitoxin system VapC family toxin [Chitinivibrionia bacterium]|nr:type II toxin-antitoxin system VapC family toxin [Chitinivibrionia bacterium]